MTARIKRISSLTGKEGGWRKVPCRVYDACLQQRCGMAISESLSIRTVTRLSFDPLGIGIVNNIIPNGAISPQSQTFLKFVPLPNTSAGTLNFIYTPQSAISRQDNYTARVDH